MPDAATSWAPGEVIEDKYVLLKPLAKGGMGSVWVAQNKLTERKVAIKFMLPELSSSPDTIQRFFREAKASARIDHPSIVDVLDLGTLPDGAPFLVMEYLEGRSLEKIIDTAPLSTLQATAIMLDVARALAAAHGAGIVHRDLKPANVFVARRGDLIVPKILDFGISKIMTTIGDMRMTRTGAVLGSPAYMSPEQARGRSDIDGRADIWAVGVMLYEAISGKLPFLGENYNQVMMAITLEQPIPLGEAVPGVDKDYLAIVDVCLQKEREQRPPTMESLSTLLDVYVAARAANGIPPLDLGEAGAPRSARLGASYKLVSQVVPRIDSRPPPTPELGSTQRADPIQMTVNAVTVVDPPRSGPAASGRRPRGPLVALLAILGAVALGALGWMFVHRPDSKPERAPMPASSIAAASGPPAEGSKASPVEVPPAVATGSAATSDSTAASGAVSESPPESPSASIAPTASAPGKSPKKPWVGTPPPKPKPSAKPSTDEGPAAVGNGPGF